MDCRMLAEELLSLHVELHLVSIERQISAFSQGMYVALQYLCTHDGAAHPRELSRGMAVSSARVASLLNRMEAQGLIRREPDPDDSRQVITFLTEKGEQCLREMREGLVREIAWLLEEIGPEDAEAYLRVRRRMAQVLRAREQAVPPCEDDTRKDEGTLA